MKKAISSISGFANISVRGRRSVCTTLATMEEKEATPTPLYRRLSALGGAAGEGNVTKTVNAYMREGKFISKLELLSCVKQLRNYKRFQHALELMEWMEKRGTNLSYKDYAVRVDLVSKTRGIESTEHYFQCLPAPAKNRFTYGALLNCYCKNMMTEKALALFEKMSELNFTSTLAYNNLMSLYMRLGEAEKVPTLVQQMKEKDISPDTFTYNVLMKSHALLKDIEGVERVAKEIETEKNDRCDWTTYTNLAAIYVEAGITEKAELALVEAEKKINTKPRVCDRDRTAYHFLISLYGGTSNLSEVHRVWTCLKSAFSKTNNLSYLVMLQALSKLDDFDGLKKCFREWESSCSSYDMRLANILVSAYLRRDMAKEAGLICEDAIKRGSGPDFRTQELFMDFFMRNNQWDLALSCMGRTIAIVKKNEWKPRQERTSAFLKHFEQEKNVDGAEELCKMLKKIDCLDAQAYSLLLSIYIAADQTNPGMRNRLEKDNIQMTSEILQLLQRVCM